MRQPCRLQTAAINAEDAAFFPLPLNAWQQRMTSPDVVSVIDRLLDE